MASLAYLRGTLCAALSDLTGTEWAEVLPASDIKDDEHRILGLTRKADGLTLGLFVASYGNPTGRIEVGFRPPRDPWTGATIYWSSIAREDSPEIGVSSSKTPEQVAKDISRRLLPAMDERWPEFLAYMERQVALRDQRKATIETLRGMGATVHEPRHSPDGDASGSIARGSRTVYFDVSHTGQVKFKETLEIDRALVVLSALLGGA